ncbi:hypothetical protein O3M35_010148 [Rhynocoris fuscipes]|uniref:Gamma-glutamylcyclotransferase family protein n=1 Tax=Rhynocoris fuscipes TaxID=488301 RepID=A0AAW1D3A8_9HEMI
MSLSKVFVYGTLKKGEPNHYWFESKNGFSKLIDCGSTVLKYPLIIGTKYNIPFLLAQPGTGYNVQGEVYEVDDRMLKNLDTLEDHPNFYIRKEDDIKLNSGEIHKCWIYFIVNFKPELLKKEMYENYSSSGLHNLVYTERYNRDPTYTAKNDILQQ